MHHHQGPNRNCQLFFARTKDRSQKLGPSSQKSPIYVALCITFFSQTSNTIQIKPYITKDVAVKLKLYKNDYGRVYLMSSPSYLKTGPNTTHNTW